MTDNLTSTSAVKSFHTEYLPHARNRDKEHYSAEIHVLE